MKTPPETESVFRILVVGLLIGSSSLLAQTWDGGAVIGASWGSANNWNPNGVPAVGANISFNNINNGKTTTTVVGSYSLGSITFQGAPNNAPVYTTNTNSLLNIGNTSLTLTGAGVINNSTNTQTFNTGVNSFGVSSIIFQNSATAGSNVVYDNSVGGSTLFLNTSNAGSATFNNTTLGFTQFEDTSSAQNATINNTLGGFTVFNDDSSAGDATIVNTAGSTVFNGTSGAGTSAITNNLAGSTSFNDTSSAESAVSTTWSAQPGSTTTRRRAMRPSEIRCWARRHLDKLQAPELRD